MIVGWCFFCEITGVGSDEFPLGKAYFQGLCWFLSTCQVILLGDGDIIGIIL